MRCSIAILTLCLVGGVISAPTMSMGDDATIKKYLMQYGYMGEESPNPALASLTDPRVYTQAIMDYQSMADIPMTGVVDAKTMEMMNMPRCGNKDMNHMASKRKKRFMTARSKWANNNLKWKVTQYTSDMSQAATDLEIIRAFKVWSDVSALTFTKVAANQAADIDIRFAVGNHGDGNPFDGRGGVLAHAFFPQFGGDAHIDDSETYTFNSTRGVNLFQVISHEFGHSLGLAHSNEKDALMYAFYRGYLPNFQLHSDDISGIQFLYGENVQVDTTTTTTPATTTTRRQPPAGTTTTTARTTTTTRATTTTTSGGVSDYCADASFDAVTTTIDGNQRTEWGFRGGNVFKLSRRGVVAGYPKRIGDVFATVPGNIDAALYWPPRYGWYRAVCGNRYCWNYGTITEGQTFFFKGDRVWNFQNTNLQWERNINQVFPGLASNIDAAFVWSGNGYTYFTKGNQYYRTRTYGSGQIDSGYPRDLSVWSSQSSSQVINGGFSRFDAVMQYSGRTYFFVGDQYYRFNDQSFQFETSYPRSVATWWYGCNSGALQNMEMDASEKDPMIVEVDGVNAVNTVTDANDYSSGSSGLTHLSLASILTCIVAALFSGNF